MVSELLLSTYIIGRMSTQKKSRRGGFQQLINYKFAVQDNSKAFTMVELLIVIAIIAILAAFLMPAMQKSLQLSKQASCANNQKQMGLGFCGYLQDHRGWYPDARIASSPWTTWCEQIAPYINIKVYEHVNPVGRAQNTPTKLFLCPEDYRADGASWTLLCQNSYGMNANWADSVQDGIYVMNSVWMTYTAAGKVNGFIGSVRESWIKDPSGTMSIVDGVNSATYTKDSIFSGQIYSRGFYYNDHDETLQYHNELNNYLFCDMHVASKTPNTAAGTGTYGNIRGIWTKKKGD